VLQTNKIFTQKLLINWAFQDQLLGVLQEILEMIYLLKSKYYNLNPNKLLFLLFKTNV